MLTVAIDFNDAGLTALADSASPKSPPRLLEEASPGYALLDDDRLMTGSDAQSRARLNPRWVHNRFWDELDTEPLPRPFPRNLSRADLAHAHLTDVWRRIATACPDVDNVIFTLPGSCSEERLALVLGIARACEIPVRGLIDSGLAAALHALEGDADAEIRGRSGQQPARLLHLDMHLHRTVLTELELGGALARQRLAVDQSVGLAGLNDVWARRIAELFVMHTRFDPLHAAGTEQSLYRILPVWLTSVRRNGDARLVIEGGGKEHTVELPGEALVSAAAVQYDSVVRLVRSLLPAEEPATLFLSHRIARLPGLEPRLRLDNPDLGIVHLPVAAAAAGALANKGHVLTLEDALPFVVRIELGAAQSDNKDTETARSAGYGSMSATHVLHQGVAHPVIDDPFLLGVALPSGSSGLQLASDATGVAATHCALHWESSRLVVEDRSDTGTFINDVRVVGRAPVDTGDRLRLGAELELQLIAVSNDHGTSAS